MNNNIIRCQVSTTASSLVSNLTGIGREHILNVFPEDYFKNIYIGQTQASSEWSRLKDDEEVKMKQTPILSVAASYVNGFDQTSWGVVPKWMRGNVRFLDRPRVYRQVFYNDEDDIYIYTIPSRFKVTIEYKVKVDTFMERIDIAHFLASKFAAEEKFYLNDQMLEVDVPQSLILAMANIKGYDLEVKDDVINFIEYLNKFSFGYLTRKRNLSTGNEMFSYLYKSNILVTVEDAPNTDGRNSEKVNQADANNIIDFSLGYEINAPTYYIFESNILPKDNYKIFNREYVAIDYTVQRKPNKVRGDKSELAWSKFVTNQNESIDQIELEELLTDETLEIIKYYKDKRLYDYLNEVFEIVCFKNNIELDKNDYRISWRDEKLTLKLNNVLLNTVYSVGIYGNRKKLMEDFVVKNKTI